MTEIHNTLYLVSRLVGFATLLQSIEYIKIKDSLSKDGIWRWSEIRNDYLFLPHSFIKFLDWIMGVQHFQELITFRFFLSLVLLSYPFWGIVPLLLFLTTFLATMRFRGTFNGGSDYLSLLLLICLSLGGLFPSLMKPALLYMALQVISSYFLAGLFKIKLKKWRDGTAVIGFTSSPYYRTPLWALSIILKPKMAKKIGWFILLFECSFPLVITHPKLTSIYLVLGAIFHLMNYIIFGINRFFWIWCASYPALWYLSSLI